MSDQSPHVEDRPRYFLVRVAGPRSKDHPPRVKHTTFEKATREAERLARLTNNPTTILASFKRVTIDPSGKAVWEDAQPSF